MASLRNRRFALTRLAAGGLFLALSRVARPERAVKRVGVIGRPGGLVLSDWKDRFPAEFSANGFEEGRNLQLVWYSVPVDSLPSPTGAQMMALARKTVAQMAADDLDCMVARGEVDARLLQQATQSTPIVAADLVDPVGAGFAKSLGHPGGNVTGLHHGLTDIALKSIELHRTLQPKMAGFAWVGFTNFQGEARPFEEAARALGLRFRTLPIAATDAATLARLDGEFAQLRRDGFLAAHLVVMDSGSYDAAVAAASRHNVALSSGDHAGPGILFCYSGDPLGQQEPVHRLPAIVARILRGEKPGDIPFEGPSRYQLDLNAKTADMLHIAFAPDLLMRASHITR